MQGERKVCMAQTDAMVLKVLALEGWTLMAEAAMVAEVAMESSLDQGDIMRMEQYLKRGRRLKLALALDQATLKIT